MKIIIERGDITTVNVDPVGDAVATGAMRDGEPLRDEAGPAVVQFVLYSTSVEREFARTCRTQC